MVFSNLPHHEKDAFFSLLDEYFQSRPQPASALSQSGNGVSESSTNASIGRVAAAAHAFGSNLPAPPRRTPGSPPPDRTPGGLVSNKMFGNVDTTSKTSMLTSSLKSKSRAPPPKTYAPPPPPAFGPKKNAFAPPPMRRAPSEPEPEPEPEPESESGEWAEALYDYDSGETGDLKIRANQQILVTEKSSADWWMGEVDGRTGLFPASYVKLL
ncbi:SH3-domain-containing protein [Armillaria novae-zelandiae]|uniref:SH3-domain-containing protein n=1 Tax=Armillaria novae-zelandiae TaxID=153914 RepID=A0AA39UJR0_9AGAR|nr:SH3-domain-containing protein [Armillaria novae-zelandiae]